MALGAGVVEGEGEVVGEGLLDAGVEEGELGRATGEVGVGEGDGTGRGVASGGGRVVSGAEGLAGGTEGGDGRNDVVGSAVLGVGDAEGGEGGAVVEVVGGAGGYARGLLGGGVGGDVEAEVSGSGAGAATPADAAADGVGESVSGADDSAWRDLIREADAGAEVLHPGLDGGPASAGDARAAVVAGELERAGGAGDAVGERGVEEAPTVLNLMEGGEVVPAQAEVEGELGKTFQSSWK